MCSVLQGLRAELSAAQEELKAKDLVIDTLRQHISKVTLINHSEILLTELTLPIFRSDMALSHRSSTLFFYFITHSARNNVSFTS